MLTFWQVTHAGFGWATAACVTLAFISAVLPWVNAAALVLALPAFAASTWGGSHGWRSCLRP